MTVLLCSKILRGLRGSKFFVDFVVATSS